MPSADQRDHNRFTDAVTAPTFYRFAWPAGVALVVPVTSARRDLPSHIEIEPGESGLDHPSYAKCEDVKSVSERRLIDRLGVVGPEPLFAVERVLRYLLEL